MDDVSGVSELSSPNKRDKSSSPRFGVYDVTEGSRSSKNSLLLKGADGSSAKPGDPGKASSSVISDLNVENKDFEAKAGGGASREGC